MSCEHLPQEPQALQKGNLTPLPETDGAMNYSSEPARLPVHQPPAGCPLATGAPSPGMVRAFNPLKTLRARVPSVCITPLSGSLSPVPCHLGHPWVCAPMPMSCSQHIPHLNPEISNIFCCVFHPSGLPPACSGLVIPCMRGRSEGKHSSLPQPAGQCQTPPGGCGRGHHGYEAAACPSASEGGKCFYCVESVGEYLVRVDSNAVLVNQFYETPAVPCK